MKNNNKLILIENYILIFKLLHSLKFFLISKKINDYSKLYNLTSKALFIKDCIEHRLKELDYWDESFDLLKKQLSNIKLPDYKFIISLDNININLTTINKNKVIKKNNQY